MGESIKQGTCSGVTRVWGLCGLVWVENAIEVRFNGACVGRKVCTSVVEACVRKRKRKDEPVNQL